MNATDDVEVLYKDLEEIHRLLNTVYNYLWAQDLAKSYMTLRNNPGESMLTQAVKRSRDRVFGYIHEAQAHQDDVEPDED